MQVSDSLGISNSGTKNQAYGQNAFSSNQEMTPEQRRALEYMWNMARGMMDATSHQYQSLMPGINQRQQQISDTAMPTWQRLLNGGAYDQFDQNRLYDSIYGAMDSNNADLQKFTGMQNRQRGNLYHSTRVQARNMNRMSNKDVKRSTSKKYF